MLSSDDQGQSGPLSNITIQGNRAFGMFGATHGGHGSMCYLVCGKASATGFIHVEDNACVAGPKGFFHQGLAVSQQKRITFPDFTFTNNLCIHGVDAQFTALEGGNKSVYGMDTAVATSVIPSSRVTSNIFYKANTADADYALGVISGGVYQSGSDNNTNPLYSDVDFSPWCPP